jgi:UDP-3-O-[3-hydroxymyristoyl] glucosamine N-acyltransferase
MGDGHADGNPLAALVEIGKKTGSPYDGWPHASRFASRDDRHLLDLSRTSELHNVRKGILSMNRIGDICELVGGTLIGDAELVITSTAGIMRASSGQITFATNERHFERFLLSEAPAAVISRELPFESSRLNGKTILICDDAEMTFAKIVQLFRPAAPRRRIGISPSAIVSDSAIIGEDVDIYPGVFVGDGVDIGVGSVIFPNVTIMNNVTIGANTRIFPAAVLYENTVVGNRCIIHAGAVIGAFGFGYRTIGGEHQRVAQLGNVVIEDDVEIGANATIDRGTFDATVVGRGTKIDNQVMIGHNCQIGRYNLLCSQVGIAGSSKTGDYVVMAGQVGIGDHLEIGNHVTLAAKAGVMHDLPGDEVYLGAPAIPAREQMRIFAVTAKLPELRKQLNELTRKIERLESPDARSQNRAA